MTWRELMVSVLNYSKKHPEVLEEPVRIAFAINEKFNVAFPDYIGDLGTDNKFQLEFTDEE